jgi:hypothetical protein
LTSIAKIETQTKPKNPTLDLGFYFLKFESYGTTDI